MSRGARRCYELLLSLSRSTGKAFPFHRTIAAKLEVSEPSVRRYIAELRKAGLIESRKRQHSSAEYRVIQTDQFRASRPIKTDRSGDRSGRFYPYMSNKAITANDLWPEQQRKPQGVEFTMDPMSDYEQYEREIEEIKRKAAR